MADVGGVIYGADQPISTGDAADGTVYCMGTRFVSDVPGNIPQIHWRSPFSLPGSVNAGVLPIQAQLWRRPTTEIVGTGEFNPLLLGQWEHDLVDWDIEADIEYIVSVVTDRYVATAGYFDVPKVNGHITAPMQAGYFHDLGSGSITPVMPDNQYNAGGYFIDIDFVPASAGPTLKVWDGTTEVSTTISVWNGTSEVSASLDSIV